MAHWANNILAGETNYARTIDLDGEVAGNVVSWQADDKQLHGCWIGRKLWGRGIATRALAEMLEELSERPLHALVAPHDAGSIQTLEKCGFVRVAAEDEEEVLLKLRAER